MTDIFH